MGQLFNLSKEARDVTARPAVQVIVQVCADIFNEAAEKLGATSMDDKPGEWIKASVRTDAELVAFR